MSLKQDLEKKVQNYVQYPLRIPKQMHKALKIQLAVEQKTIHEVLITLIEKYLSK